MIRRGGNSKSKGKPGIKVYIGLFSHQKLFGEYAGIHFRRGARDELAPTAKGLTVGKLIDDFLRHAEEKLSLGTRRMYHAGLELHVKPFFGKLTPQRLTTEMLRQYREKRSREPVQKYSKAGPFTTGKPVTQSSINRFKLRRCRIRPSSCFTCKFRLEAWRCALCGEPFPALGSRIRVKEFEANPMSKAQVLGVCFAQFRRQ